MSAEKLGETCIDEGRCHHHCVEHCFRRLACLPLSGYRGEWQYGEIQPTYPLPAEMVFTSAPLDPQTQRYRGTLRE